VSPINRRPVCLSLGGHRSLSPVFVTCFRCSYKIGQLKFVELRERARKELGAKFDIRIFHDEMLNGGVLPLDLLNARTNSWIQAQIGAEKPVAGN